MSRSNRCRAKNPATCRTHGVVPVSDYLNERMEADKKVETERQIVFNYIHTQLEAVEWGELGEKTLALIHKYAQKYGVPDVGRTRAVFTTGDDEVVKVPINDEGAMANGYEHRGYRQENPYTPVAANRYEIHDGVEVLVMERLRIASVDYKKMPDWVMSVDGGQVGYNSKGELVAYDL